MIMAMLAIAAGLPLLVWSADRFVKGAAATARHCGMSPLLIGMVIVGFGTSTPEMTVSALAAWRGHPEIALGNAYGSNIANIGLILGLTALLRPIVVHTRVLRMELPILALATALAAWQTWDGEITRREALVLLAVFPVLLGWIIRQGLRIKADALGREMARELNIHAMPIGRSIVWIASGLVVLVASSNLLVWGAVALARWMGVGELFVGLTVVAVGASLPELASSISAARQGEYDIALGNILGSNLFNTLVVVGIAGAVEPMAVGTEVVFRDVPVMTILTWSLFLLARGGLGRGRISRFGGALLLGGYLCYAVILAYGSFGE
ncbi:MAG: calcium/sodium antiporter [Desulfovibrio sp.]|nr:calcium/sodium antiporter [Desulfovibrio sp.]